ncbi:hypothetical protein PAXRUDRAFT_828607 [Paxillus rubicundulus Ve08.2h10]|uniref:Uncharacterized protein n=1 Tax=Paxillus rubicundulus Ve08.2h10 TaxID=930991 RepID=A0A0D0E792_9AGAM|nr:hypothetical protein PAXRUDRAFT_828607 [Paxillus rubicundulus Ve08.2h10]
MGLRRRTLISGCFARFTGLMMTEPRPPSPLASSAMRYVESIAENESTTRITNDHTAPAIT